MRVAFLPPLLRGRGGWATASRGALSSLAGKVEPVLVVAADDLPTAREAFPGVEIHALPHLQPDAWAEGVAALLRRLLETRVALRRLPRLHVDAVHSLEVFPTGWVGHWIAGREHVPYVLTAHGTYAVIWKRWAVLRLCCAHVLRGASAICPVSRGTAERLQLHFGRALGPLSVGSRPRLQVVPLGTDVTARVPRESAMSRRMPEIPVLVSIGAVKPRKGYHVSLRAFGRLQQQFPDARYRIGGRLAQEAYQAELMRIIDAEGIRNVEFLGEVSGKTLESCFEESSLFLLMSQEEGLSFEGFGLVFLEAGAYGLPVVGTRTGGIPDAVHDGETGILVAPDDVTGAARAMETLLRTPALARKMGLAGRAHAESLTWERYGEEMMQVYLRAVDAWSH